MIEQNSKEKQLQSSKLRQKIKKDIQNQQIDGDIILYSAVIKTSTSGFSKNNRLLFLIQGKLLAYTNELGNKVLLPFQSKDTIPNFKDKIPLDKILQVNQQKTSLKIIFPNGKKKSEWQFICSSIDLAKNWKKKIQTSIDYTKQESQNQPENIVIPPSDKIQEAPQFQEQKNEILDQAINNKAGNKPNIQNNMQKQDEKQQPKNEKINQLIGQEKQQNQNFQYLDNNQVQQQEPEKRQMTGLFNILQNKQKQIVKPQSTLYVGSVEVNSEKDQQKLKQKIQIFSSLNMKMKSQYEQKKQQEKVLKQQIKNENSPFTSILSFSTNTKLQIEKMRKQWGYEFAKGQNQYDIVYSFKIYTEMISKKIIDELGLQQKKRYYQPIQQTSNIIRYQINGVIFQIFLTQLKQSTSFQDKGTVVSKQQSKMAMNEFKNYNYVLNLTQNKGKIRIPLASVTEYKGLTAYAKVVIPSVQSYEKMDVLQRELQILQAESRINNSVFQDPQCAKIVALQSKAFQKLARAENLNSKKFDFCYIENLRYYLPHDFNNFNKDRPYERLRPQLIQDDECEDKTLYGEDMCALASRLKLPQNYRDGMEELSNISKIILERIDDLIEDLQNLEIIFTNSKQLSNVLHARGINIRYLGVVLEKSKQNWIKQIIMSEICARCGKNFLNFDLQDCLLNLSESNTEVVYNFQIKQLINFLNKMFGKGQDSQIFWKQINKQSQSYYKVSINKQEINQGFLLQALQAHCNFKLKNIDETINLFNSVNPFSISNFASFQSKSKTYDMNFTELYKSVKNLLNEASDQSYEQLRILLNLNRIQSIPGHFLMSGMYDDIVKFLVNWLPPAQAQEVYYPSQIQFGENLPSEALYQIKLAQIRWGLKNNNVQESEKVKQWMIDHINKWIGSAHPLLTDLYEIFANYHLLFKDQEKKAVNYSKNALRNQEKLIGSNNAKMADCYYLLGSIYLNYGKKVQAINTLKKAKQIIVKSQNDDSEAYGQVSLKLGQLYLAMNSVKQAIELGLNAISIFANADSNDSQIKSIQLVCRCYEILEDWQSYFNLIETDLIHRVSQFGENVELTERMIKVIILPSLKIIAINNPRIAQKILKFMEQLPETTRAPNMAYNFLMARIEQRLFPQKFLETLSDIEDTVEEIESNGMIARWKGFESLSNKSLLNKMGINIQNRGFNFIASLEALNIFIGSFVTGVLNEN